MAPSNCSANGVPRPPAIAPAARSLPPATFRPEPDRPHRSPIPPDCRGRRRPAAWRPRRAPTSAPPPVRRRRRILAIVVQRGAMVDKGGRARPSARLRPAIVQRSALQRLRRGKVVLPQGDVAGPHQGATPERRGGRRRRRLRGVEPAPAFRQVAADKPEPAQGSRQPQARSPRPRLAAPARSRQPARSAAPLPRHRAAAARWRSTTGQTGARRGRAHRRRGLTASSCPRR